MGKYEPLARYLDSRKDDSWTASFDEIEAKLGFPLPKSAHDHRAWWSNQKSAGHSQKEGWQAAGWETSEVDLHRGTVRFERRSDAREDSKPADDLWDKARSISGIEADTKLMEAALTALIQREAARKLIALGGSMPEFEAAPRKRFFG